MGKDVTEQTNIFEGKDHEPVPGTSREGRNRMENGEEKKGCVKPKIYDMTRRERDRSDVAEGQGSTPMSGGGFEVVRSHRAFDRDPARPGGGGDAAPVVRAVVRPDDDRLHHVCRALYPERLEAGFPRRLQGGSEEGGRRRPDGGAEADGNGRSPAGCPGRARCDGPVAAQRHPSNSSTSSARRPWATSTPKTRRS